MRNEDGSGPPLRRSDPPALTFFGLPSRPRLAAAIWSLVLLFAGALRLATSRSAGGRAIGLLLIAVSALSVVILVRTRAPRTP